MLFLRYLGFKNYNAYLIFGDTHSNSRRDVGFKKNRTILVLAYYIFGGWKETCLQLNMANLLLGANHKLGDANLTQNNSPLPQ